MIPLLTPDQVHYAMRFQIASIYLAPIGDVVLLGTACDIGRSTVALARRYATLFRGKPVDVEWAGWCNKSDAGRVAYTITRGNGSDALKCDLATAIGQVVGTAERYGVRLSGHDAVLARVGAATQRIADRTENSRVNGTMAAFNSEFRRRRLEAQKTGAKFPTYSVATSRLKRALAAHAPGAIGEASSDLIARVFFDD